MDTHMNWQKELEDMETQKLTRHLRNVDSPQGSRIVIDGQEVLNFCSNDYLGLANDHRLIEAAQQAMVEYGFGTGASRLVSGNTKIFSELETVIAEFKDVERSLVFSTGYMANVGVISSLFGRDDLVFSDRLNHASIVDGIQLSRAKSFRYPHCDVEALEELLKNSDSKRRKVIITDSVFSMDGDCAPLKDIVRLAKEYECLVLIDEAHALGVLGPQGKGLAAEYDLTHDIDIHVGTLSKAVGAFGGYCCGSKDLIAYLVNKSRSLIYTTGMPSNVVAAALTGLKILKTDHFRRERLANNIDFMTTSLRSSGFDGPDSQTAIIPIMIKDVDVALDFSQRLFAKGIFVAAIRPPTVPVNSARLRLTVTAAHSQQELEFAVKAIKDVAQDLKFL